MSGTASASLLSVTLFTVDDVPATCGDVIVSAIVRGVWEEQLRNGGRPDGPDRPGRHDRADGADASSAEEVILAIRRAEHLEAASDFDAWLADRKLDHEALQRFAERHSGSAVVPDDESDPDDESEWWAEAVLSGRLGEWANTLADWLVVDTMTGPDQRPSVDHQSVLRTSQLVDSIGPPGLSAVMDDERVGLIVGLAQRYEQWVAGAGDQRGIESVLARNRLDWTEFVYDELTFESTSAAREAVMCLREDGEPVAVVAERSAVPARRCSGRLDQLDNHVALALSSLEPGGVSDALDRHKGHHVYVLCSRTPPDGQDPAVRERARLQDVAELVALARAGRVRDELGLW